MAKRGKPCDPIICKCNEVPKSVIEESFKNGAKTLNEIFDHTSAGVGACGGSCRRTLQPMLEEYLKEVSQSPLDDKKKSSERPS